MQYPLDQSLIPSPHARIVGADAPTTVIDAPPTNSAAMAENKWLDELLDRWGVWVRQDDMLSYGGTPLGRSIRKRRRETLYAGRFAKTVAVDQALSDSDALAVDRCVGALPPILRNTIKMRYVHMLPNVMAAARLKTSESTFKRWLCRARGILSSQIRGIDKKYCI